MAEDYKTLISMAPIALSTLSLFVSAYAVIADRKTRKLSLESRKPALKFEILNREHLRTETGNFIRINLAISNPSENGNSIVKILLAVHEDKNETEGLVYQFKPVSNRCLDNPGADDDALRGINIASTNTIRQWVNFKIPEKLNSISIYKREIHIQDIFNQTYTIELLNLGRTRVR